MNSLQSSSTKRPPSALMKPPLACWANVEPKHKHSINNKPECRPLSRILPRAVSGSQARCHAQTETYTSLTSTAVVEIAAAPATQNAMRISTVHTPSVLLGTVEWAMTYLRSVKTLDTITDCAHFHNRHLQSCKVSNISSTGSNGTDHTAKLGDRCRSTFCT